MSAPQLGTVHIEMHPTDRSKNRFVVDGHDIGKFVGGFTYEANGWGMPTVAADLMPASFCADLPAAAVALVHEPEPARQPSLLDAVRRAWSSR